MRPPTEYFSRADRSLPLERRILNALIYIVHTRKQQPKVIYLSAEDHQQFTAGRRTWRERNYVDSIPVRVGKQSMFYSAGWWGRAI